MWQNELKTEIWNNLTNQEGLALLVKELFAEISEIATVAKKEGLNTFTEKYLVTHPIAQDKIWTELMESICYFAQKITGIEKMALARAFHIINELRNRGFKVFSPGIYSIPQWDKGLCCDWVAEDNFFLEKWGAKNITMIFDETCFKLPPLHPEWLINAEMWDSKGSFREYQWAKLRGVRCLYLKPLLEDNQIQEI